MIDLLSSKEQLITEIESDVWNAEAIADLVIDNRSLRARVAAYEELLGQRGAELKRRLDARLPVETSDVDKRLSDEYFRGWHDGFSSAEGGPRAAARQDLAYYNGAQQAAAMAHQSLKNMDAWIAGGCGNRWTEAKRELAGSSVEPARELTLLDFGYAPGNYTFRCHDCGQESVGDKRALRCETCANQALRENRRGAVKASGEQLHRMRPLCICDNALTNRNPACPVHGEQS